MNQVLGNCEKLMVWMYRYRLQTIIGRAITTAHSCFAFLLPMAAVSFLLGPSLVIPISRSSSSVIVSRWAKSISCSRKISRYFSRPVDIFVPFLLNWIYSAINEFWKCGIRYVDLPKFSSNSASEEGSWEESLLCSSIRLSWAGAVRADSGPAAWLAMILGWIFSSRSYLNHKTQIRLKAI